MHDLIHDLAQSITKDIYFRIETGDHLENIPNNAHHMGLSLRMEDDQLAHCCNALYKGKSLRTVVDLYFYKLRLTYPRPFLDNLFNACTCLRVLCLHGIVLSKSGLPDSIGNLKLLQYLDLSFTEIPAPPTSICSLYNLQILLFLGNYEFVNDMELGEVVGSLVNIQLVKMKTYVYNSRFPQGYLKLYGKCIKLKQVFLLELELLNMADIKEVNFKKNEDIEELTFEWNGRTERAMTEEVIKTAIFPQDSENSIQCVGRELFVSRDGIVVKPLFQSLKYLEVSRMPNWEDCDVEQVEALTLYPPPSFEELNMLGIHDCQELGDIEEGKCLGEKNEECFILVRGSMIHGWRVLWQICASELKLPTSLQELRFENCEHLQSLPKNLQSLTSLEQLCILECPCVMFFPEGGLPTTLKRLMICGGGEEDMEVPPKGVGLHKLTSLRSLTIQDYCGLWSFPDEEWLLPTSLELLYIGNAPMLMSLPKYLQSFTSL
ncbi:PREDICTED: putative disease resistance protein At3g14460 [Nelumbo nucifera]|uniref:Disease resistance protein At3g14460 n=1 Tax=Nelumbo nucifera TaxID=4432 RepID=A0A1U8Q664_NELNU|nr:PREDICTED: putative disease resistance protein At3g14460 [Nelumbo nucifera]